MWILQQIVTAWRDLEPEGRAFIRWSYAVLALVLLGWPAIALALDAVLGGAR